MLWAWSVAAVASCFLWGTNAGRVADPIFVYTFNRAECLAGYASEENIGNSSVFGNLTIDTSSIICRGLGVEAKPGIRDSHRIISTSNSSAFVEEMGEGVGWTFEAWVTFRNFSDCPSCILRNMVSIERTNGTLAGVCPETSSMSFMQRNEPDSMVMRTRGVGPRALCQETLAELTFDWEIPLHLIYTTSSPWGFDTAIKDTNGFVTSRWYINGLLVHVNQHEGESAQWQDGFYLQLLNDAAAGQVPSTEKASPGGSVFLVAMYRWPLNDSEVWQNFDAGLADSPPVAEDITIIINEDGANGEYYDAPGIYLRDPMIPALNLPIIFLLATDMDQEQWYPGFDDTKEPVLPKVFVDSLPLSGELLDVHGNTITNLPHFVEYDDGYGLRYRPERNGFSGPVDVYASFTYSAVDGTTGEKSVVAGVVDIHVLPANDPPVPDNISATVSTGDPFLLFLGGTDVDIGDDVQGALIVEPPAHGVLYQVQGDDIIADTKVDSGDSIPGQYIYYLYAGNTSGAFDLSSGTFLIQDKFTFRLYDYSHALSTLGTASLAINNGLNAVTAQSRNDSSWMCIEDTESTVRVYVEDSASSQRDVVVVILSVPEHGSLQRMSGNYTLKSGDTVGTNCTDERVCVSSLRYMPLNNYFNSPTLKWNGEPVSANPGMENFSFYAVANDNGLYSNKAVQSIQVNNSNDPTDVLCPKQAHGVHAYGSNVYANDGAWIPLDRTAIGGGALVDPDEGVDVVKVEVSARFGLVSLREGNVSLLDFNSATYCQGEGSSQCSGSGNSDRTLIFVADPSDAQIALENIVYQSLGSDVIDSISITVLDGVNGNCLSEEKFPTGTIRQSCWQASCTFNITVGSRTSTSRRVLNSDLSAQVWISVSISLSVLLCLVWRRCKSLLNPVRPGVLRTPESLEPLPFSGGRSA